MNATDFLSHILNVKELRPGKYVGCCPGHPDKNPSLSIRETDNRILLHCWAGCPTEEILHALGLEFADLFVQSQSRQKPSRTPQPPRPRHWKRIHHDLLNRAEDFHHRADKIFNVAKGVDLNNLKDDAFDVACHCVGIAYDAKAEAERLETLADAIAHAGRAEGGHY